MQAEDRLAVPWPLIKIVEPQAGTVIGGHLKIVRLEIIALKVLKPVFRRSMSI
jgi:hypothetical protein